MGGYDSANDTFIRIPGGLGYDLCWISKAKVEVEDG